MLMDHPDTQGYRIVRRVDFLNLAVNQNLTFVRLVESIGDAHCRRLTGAVFTNDGMNRSPRDFDVNVIVR
jgi:hypothetical protein